VDKTLAPTQRQHGLSGSVVHGSDRACEVRGVAEYLDTLFEDEERYEEMSEFAKTHVSDEVGTVGNAVCWMYLAERLTSRYKVQRYGKWIWDLARPEAGEPIGRDETTLPRRREGWGTEEGWEVYWDGWGPGKRIGV
jgi:alpha,alpha-trehalose phosphorylase (configuration-retaining)